MGIDIDGYAVLGAIARRPQAFPAIKNEVSKVARTLVVKQLKDKSISLADLKGIVEAIEHDAFALVIDLMSDAEIKSLLGKVDKLNGEAKAQTPQWQRKHVSELADGKVIPSAKRVAGKAPAKPKVENAPTERAANARFAKATRKKA